MEKQAGIPGNIPSLSQNQLREAGLGCVERGRMGSEALEKFFLDFFFLVFFFWGLFLREGIELPGARRSRERTGPGGLGSQHHGAVIRGTVPS